MDAGFNIEFETRIHELYPDQIPTFFQVLNSATPTYEAQVYPMNDIGIVLGRHARIYPTRSLHQRRLRTTLEAHLACGAQVTPEANTYIHLDIGSPSNTSIAWS